MADESTNNAPAPQSEDRPARPGETCTCGNPATIVYVAADHGDVPYCGTPHATPPAERERFTWGLIGDVFDVLERHGYRKGDDQHTGQAIGILGDLVDAYEGLA